MPSPSATNLESSARALRTRSSNQMASRPRPMENTTSASATLATSLAPGTILCGSAPGECRLKTSTLSPPITSAQSATMLEVATTWRGGLEGVAVAASVLVPAAVERGASWVGCALVGTLGDTGASCVSWSPAQATKKATPNMRRPTAKAWARRREYCVKDGITCIPKFSPL